MIRSVFVLIAVLIARVAAAQQPCVASAPQVVDDVYKQVLGRPADPGSAPLAHALGSGRMTVRDVVATVARSPEYEVRFFWPPVVAAVYRQVMQREANAAEIEAAARQLANGSLTAAALVANVATRAANNSPDAIPILYRRLLGRDPDPDGLRAYTAIAERDGLQAVTESIVSSPEYRSRAATAGAATEETAGYADAVRSMYRQLLGREADPDGLRSLVEVATVYGAKGPIDRMLNSPEYRQRYGDSGIPGRQDAFCGAAPAERAPVNRAPAIPRRR
jgi:hypothetical protein